jgi:hypothetical protein
MYPMFPGETLTGAMEMACYAFTVAAAFIGCLLTIR